MTFTRRQFAGTRSIAHRHARAALTAAAVALAACAPAATSPPQLAPRYEGAPLASARTAGRATAARTASAAPSGAAAPGSVWARWAGHVAEGGRRAPVTVQLRGDAAGGVRGTVERGVTPRTSTFTPRGAAPARAAVVTVPITGGRYAAGRLEFETEPYYDAACECTVTAVYRGLARGDTLAGTVTTRGAATTAGTRARWRAVRIADPVTAAAAAGRP